MRITLKYPAPPPRCSTNWGSASLWLAGRNQPRPRWPSATKSAATAHQRQAHSGQSAAHATSAAWSMSSESSSKWRELRGEVAKLPGLGPDAHPGKVGGTAGHSCGDLDHVVDVALGVGAAGHGEADQVHGSRGLGAVWVQAEHHCADLAGPDPALQVERAG